MLLLGVLRRLYYSDCKHSFTNTGSLLTCDLADVADADDGLDCHVTSLLASFVCVSSLFVSQRHRTLFWADAGLGLIASSPLHRASGRARILRSV